MSTYQVRSGDTITMDPSVLSKRDGTVAVITGATVRFQSEDWVLGSTVVDQAATVSDGPNGKVTYTFISADTVRKGTFRARWKVTYSGGAVETFPTAPTDLNLVVY